MIKNCLFYQDNIRESQKVRQQAAFTSRAPYLVVIHRRKNPNFFSGLRNHDPHMREGGSIRGTEVACWTAGQQVV